MSFIVVRQGGDLQIVPETFFPSEQKEEDLHRILESEPRFVAVEGEEGELIPTVVVASKFTLPSGDQLDLLLLDGNGDFVLCELKKGNITRKTIGQILDYAAQLAEMSVDDFKTQVEQAKQKLQEQMREDWDNESFSDEVLNESLKNPHLVLIGWQVDEDALRIAKWLQKRGVVRMECYAFEYFRSGETEIFVPRNLTPMEKGRDQPEPLSQRHFLRMKFWEDMLRRLGDRVPHRRKPTKERWLSFGIGIGGVDVHWSGAKSELRVNLFVNKERHPTLVNKLRDFLPALLKRETGEEWSVTKRRRNSMSEFQEMRAHGFGKRPKKFGTGALKCWSNFTMSLCPNCENGHEKAMKRKAKSDDPKHRAKGMPSLGVKTKITSVEHSAERKPF